MWLYEVCVVLCAVGVVVETCVINAKVVTRCLQNNIFFVELIT